jgi:biopolymer transport protein ExbD
MADIAFLLIVFFMVTTIFKLEQGLPITLPRSVAGEKIPREKIAHVWIDRDGLISIDDLVISVLDIEPMVTVKMRENPALIISFNTDAMAPYKVVDESMERLKLANALRVSFTTMPEEG